MVDKGKARLFKRKDGKYLVYLPKDVCEDSLFPFKEFEAGPRAEKTMSIALDISFSNKPKSILLSERKEQA